MKQHAWGNLCVCSLAMLVWAAAGGVSGFGAAAPPSEGRKLMYEEPTLLGASIYPQPFDGKHLLFSFKRVANRSGSTLKVQRDFTYTDGHPAVRERVGYEGDALVSFELEDLQTGAAGSAKIRRDPANPAQGSIQFESRKQAGARPKTSTEPLKENTLINDMVGPFLASHWDELARGQEVRCRVIVVSRRETVGFTFVKSSEPAKPSGDTITVKMEATSAFIAALVDPLVFQLELAPPHRVRQYVGRTTPKIQAGSKWKDLDAVTVFDWRSAR